MKQVVGRGVTVACILAAALAGAPGVLAETKTYCDDKCGDSQKCKYTCCHITTTPVGGGDIITNISCSSSVCCAHPQGAVAGSSFDLPAVAVEGVSAPIRWDLAGAAGLDASAIAVRSDDKTKTVTLSGTVKSADQLRLAGKIAKKKAKGYKVANQLTIAK